jgi:hypothetical protein
MADAPMARPFPETRTSSQAAPTWRVRASPMGLRSDNPAGQQASQGRGKLGADLLTCYDTQTSQVAPTSTPVLRHNAIQGGSRVSVAMRKSPLVAK